MAERQNSTFARRWLSRRGFLRGCAGVAAVGVAEGFLEPYRLDTTRHDVFVPHLPGELDGLTVAQLTDLHRGALTPDEVINEAIRQTRAASPDLILLTGDFVEKDAADALPLAQMLASLSAPLGLWGCLGNHDYADDAEQVAKAVSETARVRLLRNASAQVAPGLWLSGIEDTHKGNPRPDTALRDVPKESATLFLTHNPVGVRYVTDRSCIALAGHTHGGQVRVPGGHVHYPPGMNGFTQFEGWGDHGRARLYISRGIGTTGFAVRFRCTPELTFLTLRAAV